MLFIFNIKYDHWPIRLNNFYVLVINSLFNIRILINI